MYHRVDVDADDAAFASHMSTLIALLYNLALSWWDVSDNVRQLAATKVNAMLRKTRHIERTVEECRPGVVSSVFSLFSAKDQNTEFCIPSPTVLYCQTDWAHISKAFQFT